MDIKDTETKLDHADSFLTKLKSILKKHWGILLLLLVGYGVYVFFGMVGEEMDKQNQTVEPTETADSTKTLVEPYVVESYEDYDEDGNAITILVWNDGIETVE